MPATPLPFRLLLTIPLLLLVAPNLFAQIKLKNPDSLKQVVRTATTDTARCQALAALTITYAIRMDLPQARDWGRQALKCARQTGNTAALGAAHYAVAHIYLVNAAHDSALIYANQARSYFEQSKNPKNVFKSYNLLGIIYRNKHQFYTAIDCYNHALNTVQGEVAEKIPAYLNLAELYMNLGEHAYKRARSYAEKSLAIAQQHQRQVENAAIEHFLADLDVKEGLLKQGLQRALRCRPVLERGQQKPNLVISTLLIASAYMQLGYRDSGLYYAHLAEQISAESPMRYRLDQVYAVLGKTYLDAGNMARAAQYTRLCRQVTDSLHQATGAQSPHAIFYQFAAAQGDYQAAFLHYQTYKKQTDSIRNQQINEQVTELELRYHTERTERELARMQETQRTASLRQRAMAGAILLLLAGGFLFWRNERAQTRQREVLLQQQHALAEAENLRQRLEREQIEANLAYKNKELTTLALHIARRNEAIDQVREQLKEIVRKDEPSLRKDLTQFIRNMDAQEMLQEEVNHFNIYLDEANADFRYHLRTLYPELTPGEERLCTLLRLNLSTPEIASLNGTSPGTIHVAMHRLRKKMNQESRESLVAQLQAL